ncbi:hypothetical protein [Flavobacterium sp. 3HN19-14]|uniref:hypothetical protein n=1 Tax=Flavobacterium sp. 3HN19-14 TaxID=3448133 RepID=UPI003EE0008D
MKKFLIPLMVVSGFFGVYEQSKDQPNIYIVCGCIVVFMISLMQFGSKLPSNHKEKDNDDVQ